MSARLPRADLVRRFGSNKIPNGFLLHHPRRIGLLGEGVGIKNTADGFVNKVPHLRPCDAVHLYGIHAFRDCHTMRPRDELAAVNHVRDSVHGQNQVLASGALHRGNRIGAGIRGPRWTAVMEIEKAQTRQRDDLIGNFLAVGRHQNQVRSPIVAHQGVELGRLHSPGEGRKALGDGEPTNKRLVVLRVRVFLKPHLGIGEWLRGIIGCHANHFHAIGQFARKQFLEDVVAAHEAAEHSNPRPEAVAPGWSVLPQPDSRRQRALNEPVELFTRLAIVALVRVPPGD